MGTEGHTPRKGRATDAAITRLVTRAQRGDQDAFSELYKIYFPQIYYFALKRLRSDDLASEATQATFLGVCTNLDQLKSPAAFRFWIFRIAQRAVGAVAAERNRSAAYDLPLTDDEGFQPAAQQLAGDATQQPEAVLDDTEVREALYSGINHLPEHQREIVILFYFAGFNIAEIARLLDIKPGAVRKRLFDARAQLKKRFVAPLEEITDESPAQRSERLAQRRVLADYFARDLSSLDLGQAQTNVASGLSAALPLVMASPQALSPASLARAQGLLAQLHAGANAALPGAQKVVTIARKITLDPFTTSGISKAESALLWAYANKAVLIAAAVIITTTGASATWLATRGPASGPPRPAPIVRTTSQETSPTTASAPTTPTPAPATTTQQQTPAPAPTPAPTPSPTPAPTPAPAPQRQRPTLTVAHSALTYSVGTPVSADRMLADCGASATDADGNSLAVTIAGVQTVDFTTPGTAHIYLQATDATGLATSITIPVTIVP